MRCLMLGRWCVTQSGHPHNTPFKHGHFEGLKEERHLPTTIPVSRLSPALPGTRFQHAKSYSNRAQTLNSL